MKAVAANAVAGVFSNAEQARIVIEELRRAGFPADAISVVTRSNDGGFTGVLSGIGIPLEDAHVYAEGLEHGGALVSVGTLDHEGAERAASIMDDLGAMDLDSQRDDPREHGLAGTHPGVEEISEDELRRERGWPHNVAEDIGESLVATAVPEEGRRHRARIY